MRVMFYICLILLSMRHVLCAEESKPSKDQPKPPIEHVEKQLEGWTVHVDRRLLEGEHQQDGGTALRLLSNKLFELSLILPEDKVRRMRETPIYIDLDHPLGNMQYHPSRGWLQSNGYDTAMTQAVHIPSIKHFVNVIKSTQQPSVVLHELTHAYHDRVLGFDDKTIRDAFDKAAQAKLYDKVLCNRRGMQKHYALTNHKEYFAEMTESYFGVNDFYPFVRAELKEYDPATYEMLERVWR